MPMEMITAETLGAPTNFYWREVDGVRALVCAPLEQDGFTNGFSTRWGGVSPFPDHALNLAGFNEDTAENILENRRRFLKLFSGPWTLTGCWQVHGADVRLVKDEQDAQPVPGVLGDGVYCDALVSDAARVLLGVKTADCVPILIGDSLLADAALLGKHLPARDLLLVSNTTVAPLYAERVRAALGDRRIIDVRLPDGEQYKSMEYLARVLDVLVANRFARDCVVLALGGGVVGDLAGFAAACYQRGVAFAQGFENGLWHGDYPARRCRHDRRCTVSELCSSSPRSRGR